MLADDGIVLGPVLSANASITRDNCSGVSARSLSPGKATAARSLMQHRAARKASKNRITCVLLAEIDAEVDSFMTLKATAESTEKSREAILVQYDDIVNQVAQQDPKITDLRDPLERV